MSNLVNCYQTNTKCLLRKNRESNKKWRHSRDITLNFTKYKQRTFHNLLLDECHNNNNNNNNNKRQMEGDSHKILEN